MRKVFLLSVIGGFIIGVAAAFFFYAGVVDRQSSQAQLSKKPGFRNLAGSQDKLTRSKQMYGSAPVASSSATTPSPSKRQTIRVTILNYHHVGYNPNPSGDPTLSQLTIAPEEFDKEMAWLASHNYTTVTLDDLLAALLGQSHLPTKPIILTFDDGYEDFFTNAFPILSKYRIHAYEALISDYMGKSDYLTWDQIKLMTNSGLVQLIAHTRHHKKLTELSVGEIDYEVAGSKQVIEEQTGQSIRWFAYPYGSLNRTVVKRVQAAGFAGAIGTLEETGQSLDQLFNLRRIHVGGPFPLEKFAAIVETK